MSDRRRLARVAMVAGACGALVLLVGAGSTTTVAVPPGASVQEAVDLAPAGGTVRLESGVHQGPVLIRKTLALTGAPGARLVAPIEDRWVLRAEADGVSVSSLTIEGASTGIFVQDADAVSIHDVAVHDPDLHGIEIVDASARITAVRVEGMRHPMAQGIEVRNADHRPETYVGESIVIGGQEGLVSHVARVHFEHNVVQDTTMRAITITEMSRGEATGNRISGAAGIGLFCGDESRCAFSDNWVEEVAPGHGGRSSAGWGLVVHYYSTASTDGDQLAGAAGPLSTFIHSRFTDSSPLRLGAGWDALVPWSIAAGIAIAVLVAVYLAVRFSPLARYATRLKRPADYARAATAVLLVGLGVQTFHMAEHFLQVYRVHFDGVPSRGGIVGPVVEAELIHFIYNAAVIAAVVFLLLARRRGWQPAGRRRSVGDELLLVALAVQSYHVVEHTVKVFQHVTTGAKVNPGILGGMFELVWLHFAINLTVYLAYLGASVAYLYRGGARATSSKALLAEPASSSS
jgi:hypothetical protein